MGVERDGLAKLLLRTSSFVFEAHRLDDKLKLYLYVELGESSLRRIIGVRKEDPPGIPPEYYYAELRQSPDEFYRPLEVLGWDDVYELLADNMVLQVMAWRDPKANKILSKKARELMRPPGQSYTAQFLSGVLDGMIGSSSSSGKQQYVDPALLKERQQQGREVLKRAAKPVYVVRIRLYGPDKGLLKDIASMIAPRFSRPLRVFTPLVGGRLGKRDPRRIPGPSGFFGSPDKELLWMTPEELRELLVLPDPSTVPVDFMRGAELPRLVPERTGPDTVRIGVLENGREFRISLRDLYRHAYIIGMTGSGKSTLLWNLALWLHATGKACVVVIDPHGDLALDILSSLEDHRRAYLLDPLRKPFGLNPLDLPRLPDRGHAISLAVDQLIAIFEKVLKLPETAVNVRYLLQVLLRLMYSRTDSPTLGDIYNAIVGLKLGTLDLPVDDPEWSIQVEMLQKLQDQTFLSALSRLEPFAHNKLLSRITCRTTIDLEEMLRPSNLVLFRISKAELGEGLLQLLAPSIILRLWFYVLERALLNKPRTPVIVFIDEFQNMAGLPVVETILSEARKYGLHLVMAHQHTRQIPDELLQSVFSNTGVKIVFRVGGHEVDKLSRLDRDFADKIARALTSLTIGRALVQLTARPGEQQPPPVIVRTDPPPEKKYDPWTILEKLPGFTPPPEDTLRDPAELLNPVLKYLPRDRLGPVEQVVLYRVYRLGGRKQPVQWTSVIAGLGARRPLLDEARDSLVARGCLEAWKEGNKWMVKYVKGLYVGLKQVAPSREGRLVARRAILHYLERGWYVCVARQDPGLRNRPDLVAVPIDKTGWSLRYGEAIAVEVESCNEVETHPEQVSRNLVKGYELIKQGIFRQVEFWTTETCRDKLAKILEETAKQHRIPGQTYRIHTVKPKPKKPQKQSPQTMEKQATDEKPAIKNTKEEQTPELIPVQIQGQTLYLTRQQYKKYQKLIQLGYKPRPNPQNNEIILEKKGRKTKIKTTQPHTNKNQKTTI